MKIIDGIAYSETLEELVREYYIHVGEDSLNDGEYAEYEAWMVSKLKEARIKPEAEVARKDWVKYCVKCRKVLDEASDSFVI